MTKDETPLAWKHYTRPLERRLQHLETKQHQNSFDKHEASALRHVLEIVTQPQRKPLTEKEIRTQFCGDPSAYWAFHDGVRYAEAAHGVE